MKEVEMWTDGSALKAPDGKFYCGAGCLLVYGEKERRLSESISEGTVNISELTAPILGLQCLKEKCKVTIFSDSQYTINTQVKWFDGWKRRGWITQGGESVKNKDLIQQLDHLCNKHDVTWVKVKSHSGLIRNDIADELAVMASNKLKLESNHVGE